MDKFINGVLGHDELLKRRGIYEECRFLERCIARKEAERKAVLSVSGDVEPLTGKADRLLREIADCQTALDKCEAIRTEVEEFIARTPDSEVRLGLRLPYLHGFTWMQIGVKLGHDESYIRRKIDKYLCRDPKKSTTEQQ